MLRLTPVLIALAILPLAGCAGGDAVPASPYALSERSLYGALDQVSAPASDSAEVAERAAFAARRMRAAGLMPALASSFRVRAGRPPVAGAEHVLGYVPGRHPSHADTLVIVAARLEGAVAAAVLETARRLALEALDDVVPERSLLFALWSPASPPPLGVTDFLSRPTWGLDRVALAIVVGEAAAEGAALFEAQDIAAEVVLVPEAGSERDAARALAEQLYERVRAAGFGAGAAPALTTRLR